MPKHPTRPRWTPPAPDRTYRTFAHVWAFDAACPACGTISVIAYIPYRQRSIQARRQPGASNKADYDPVRGAWTCRACARVWLVGVLLWPAEKGRRPGDHVPTPEELGDLRLQLGHVSPGAPEGARAPINRVCLCGVDCPMHPSDVKETD